MINALAARATSLGASALLLVGLGLIALTMTYTIRDIDLGPPSRPIEVLPPEAPPPPPEPVRRPQARPLETSQELLSLAPIEPVSTSGEIAPFDYAVVAAGPVEITAPRWLRRPHDLERYYPARALERNVEGEVLLDCLVSPLGALECRVLSEAPAGWGFGSAAVRMSRDHRMAPAMADGRAVEGRYRMRVPFALD